MFIIRKNDGSLKFAITNDYIMQGSNNVNFIDFAIEGRDTSTWSADCLFKLPNGSTVVLAGTPKEFTYSGETYQGYRVLISSAVTIYAGTLQITARQYDGTGAILYTYPFSQTINATTLPDDWEAPITQAQYNSFMRLLTSYINAYDNHLIRKYDTLALATADISNITTTEHVMVSDGTTYAMYYKANASDTTLTLIPQPMNWNGIYDYIGITKAQLTAYGYDDYESYVNSLRINHTSLSFLTGILTSVITLNNGSNISSNADLSNLISDITYSKAQIDAKLGLKANASDVYTKANTYSKTEIDTQQATQDQATATAQAKANEAYNVAITKTRSFSFATYTAMVNALYNDDGTTYKVGDILLIADTEVADFWVYQVNATKTEPYGYYEIKEYETDMTTYQKKLDDSLNTTSKLVVGAINENKASITALENTKNKLTQLDFTGTLASGVITFEPTDNATYDLVDNTQYELDLHLAVAGSLTNATTMVINLNGTPIKLNAITGDATVGRFKQLEKYSNDTGYRWITKVIYNTVNSTHYFSVVATISKENVKVLTESEITAQINELENGQLVYCYEGATTYIKGHTYKATYDYSTNTNSLSDVSIFVPTKTSDLTNDSNFITNTDFATENVGGVIKCSALTGTEQNIYEVLIDPTTHKLYAPALPAQSVVLVATLPATGVANTIYLVPKATAEVKNAYDEYIWVNSAWELIGAVSIDLSNYYTKDQVDAKLTANALVTALGTTPVNRTTGDKNGNDITSTYATKTELETKGAFVINGSVATDGTITFTNLVIANLETAITNNQHIVFKPSATYPCITLTCSVADGVYNLIGSIATNGDSITNYECAISIIDNVADGTYTAKQQQSGVPHLFEQTFTLDGAYYGSIFKGTNQKLTQTDIDNFNMPTYPSTTWEDTSYYGIANLPIVVTSANSLPITTISQTTTWDNATWENIINGANNYEFTSSDIGKTKVMSINGVDYVMRLIGVNHDTLTTADGTHTKANTTWQMVDLLATTYKMNNSNTNVGGWTDSVMRQTTMATLLAQLPTIIQNNIKSVDKLTSAGNQSATINTTSDKLFLLSEIEIFGATTYSKAGEGTQYAYWSAHNTATDRIKHLGSSSGNANYYWERSPYSSNATGFCTVGSNGNASSNNASNSGGVSLAFCL